MKKLKKKILISRNNRYQNTLWDLRKIQEYYKYKFLLLKKNYLKKKDPEILTVKDASNNFITYNLLEKLYFKKLSKKDIKLIKIFYKKYSSNLVLKKKYNQKFKKVSKLNAEIGTYIYLGFLTMKLKLNNILKLNIILKINDHIFLNEHKLKNDKKFLFSNLLALEINLLKKVLAK
tara:strand:+ start:113 stop:640 length:528 start_codon:yes stop_codon:yes gene_type:complete